MDFGTWSPTHTVLVIFAIIAFIGQVAVYFYRTGQNDKKIEKQGETFVHALERLEDRIDKRFIETNARLDDVNQRLSDMQADTNQRFTETNQRLSDMQADTNQRFTETNQCLSAMQADTNQRLSDIESGIRQLNQNHIDHLTHHNR